MQARVAKGHHAGPGAPARGLRRHGAARPAGAGVSKLSNAFNLRRSPDRPADSVQTRAVEGVVGVVEECAAAALQPFPGLQGGVFANTVVFTLGIKVLLKGLTPLGVLNSWVLGASVYSAFGAGGYLLVCLYFIFGTAVTKLKLEQKQKEGIAEARSGRRSWESVWGSGLAGVFCAVMALATGDLDFWRVGFIASFGSKLADTVSSEVGKAYGKTTFLVTTFEKVPRGTEGAISLEGTLGGVAAAFGYAIIAAAVGQVTITGALVCTAAAFVANLFESYLGASVQDDVDWLTNDVVNMIQISVAALLATGLTAVIS